MTTSSKGLEWAAAQARCVIHDNDVERLKQLPAEYPALLSWRDDDDHGGLMAEWLEDAERQRQLRR